jgi:hypothetical protein
MDDNMNKFWEWNHQPNRYEGLNLTGGKLVWYLQMSPDWAGSAATEQTFEDFMVNGPAVSCPPDVEREAREFLSAALLEGKWRILPKDS